MVAGMFRSTPHEIEVPLWQGTETADTAATAAATGADTVTGATDREGAAETAEALAADLRRALREAG
jgi:hypothetical protein